MAFLSKLFALASFFSAVYTAPVGCPPTTIIQASSCAKWGIVNAHPYELQSNLWGSSDASSGSQCTNLTSSNGKTVSWSTSWNWSGGGQVKSFSNVQLNSGIGTQLSAISSMSSTWKWSQSSSGAIIADVAYDMFTSSSPNGTYEHEIMVWLASFNSQPISYNYDASGTAVAIMSNIKIGKYTWNLYEGNNGYNMVWSFIPTDSRIITNFKGDVNLFLNHLTSKKYIPSSQYLEKAQGGTE
ncbi:glycoside hydrolase family 12 protein, partial [Piloderma croceum F 1598]